MFKVLGSAAVMIGATTLYITAFAQSPRGEASRYDTRMCHLVYKDLKSGSIVNDPDSEPESYIEMMKTTATLMNEKYPGRRYSVTCVPIGTKAYGGSHGEASRPSSGNSPIYIDVDGLIPYRVRVSDLQSKGRELLSTPVFKGHRRFLLPMNLRCRPTAKYPDGTQFGHILVEAFADGKRYSKSLSADLCEQDDDGQRVIAVGLCKLGKYCTEANRLEVSQIVLNPM